MTVPESGPDPYRSKVSQFLARMEEPDSEDPSAPSRALAEGNRIGPYRLLRRLGGGAMGVVWLAEEEELDRRGFYVVAQYEDNDPTGRDEIHRIMLETSKNGRESHLSHSGTLIRLWVR